jgi:hypothetical protein
VINYVLPEKGDVTICLYDINGKMINKILSQKQIAGTYSLLLNSTSLAEGVYHCIFTFDNGSKVYTNRKTIVQAN